jgi:hypothetical protein
MPPKNAKRNEKDRKRRADGLLRHQQDLAEEQAEIDHLHGSLTPLLPRTYIYVGAYIFPLTDPLGIYISALFIFGELRGQSRSRGDHSRLPEVYAALG